MHAAANTVFAFPNLDWAVYVLLSAVVALVTILAGRMWKKLPAGHPAVYRSPEHAAQPHVEPMVEL